MLTDNLRHVWKLDEASGSALDLISGISLSTSASPPTSTTVAGSVFPTVRNFASANTQYLTISDTSSVSLGGNISFQVALYARFASTAGGFPMMFTKDDVGGNREFALYYFASGLQVTFECNDGSAIQTAQVGLSVVANTWYLFMFGRDAANSLIFCSVNNGTKGTHASTGTLDAAAPFQIGARNGANSFDGQIGPVYWWDRILTATEEAQIYNAGAGQRLLVSPPPPRRLRSSRTLLRI
jgi:hypothetical protein